MTGDDSEQFVLLNRVADEFAERYRSGERPSLSEFIHRHPDFANEIREFFPAIVEVEQIKEERQAVSEPAATGPLPPLERLGEFRIIREIGRGGMGVVYEAEQVSLGRRVALKVLPKQLLFDSRTKQRFEREAKAAARLHHTNIVPVFGVGEHDGLPYYVMQFIHGTGLNIVINELRQLPTGSKSTLRPPSSDRGEASAIAQSLIAGVPHPDGNDATAATTAWNGEHSQSESPARSSDSVGNTSSVILPGQGDKSSSSKSRKVTFSQSVARIGFQVAAALEYAHQQGIVHRDVKPSNLLLDLTGTVWVTDFGLAKTDDQQNLTNSGDVLGTLRYMPPEAFEGQADARGDIYSIGLTLYELLALQPAFRENDRNQIIKQVTTTEPAPLDRLRPGVPRDLVTIIHKAISKEPSQRYQTANALAEDLQRFLEDEPILARRSTAVERTWRWCRRNPLTATLVAAVAFLLVLGTTLSTYFAINATLAKDRADAEALNARSNAIEALATAQREAAERRTAIAEKVRADREADAARTSMYVLRVNTIQVALESANFPLARDLLELIHPSDARSNETPGWEWNYHWRFCHSDHRTLNGHAERVTCADFSSDGAQLVSSADDGTVRLWDVATGEQLKCFALKKSKFHCVAFSSKGGRVAVGCEDGQVRLLEAAGLQELSVLKGHSQRVRSLTFSPDGARLFTVSDDGTAKFWDVPGARELLTIPESVNKFRCVAVSPDGRCLALGGENGTLSLRDAATGKVVRTLPGHTRNINAVAFSPDGKRLASTGVDRAVVLWDVNNGQELRTLLGHASEVRSVAFSPDGKRLASGGHDEVMKLWDLESGQDLASYLGHTRGLYRVAFSPDGRWLASASSDLTICLWDTNYRPGPRILKGHDNQVRSVAFTPNRERLVAVGLDGRIKQWDVLTGQELSSLPGPGAGLLCLALSPDGRFLATGGDPGVVTVLDAKSGRNAWTLKGHKTWLTHVAFSPDSRWLASGSHDNTIKLWDAAKGQELRTFNGHTDDIKGLVFSSDGTRLFSGSNDRTIKEWDVTNGREIRTLNGHTEGVTDIALSPDGRWLASASHDKTVKLWDLASGQPLRTFRGHNDTAWSLAFHPSGTRLASAGWDQSIRLWDTVTGYELANLKGHTDRVLGVAFSPDGGFLASAGGIDLTVRLWDGRPIAKSPPQGKPLTPMRGAP